MFTGIIEEVGKVERIQRGSSVSKLSVRASKVLEDIQLGDSIAINGVCLTVVYFNSVCFTVDVMNETWKLTNLAKLTRHCSVNLERALPAHGRFGGHIVSGHIDGIGTIRNIAKDGNAIRYRIETSKEILEGIVMKGSIAVNGISLTVVSITKKDFTVSVIPLTLQETMLKDARIQDVVNLETDVIGKYVRSLLGKAED